MPLPRTLLHDGEDVILDLPPHWWTFVKPGATVTALAVLLLVVADGIDNDASTYLVLVMLLVALGWLSVRYFRWATTNVVLTTDRLIHRSGVLAKAVREISLERLDDVAVHQSLFGRLVGLGDLVVDSGGGRGQQRLTGVRRPFAVQDAVSREAERARAREADRHHGRRELGIPEQIEKLDELRRRGIVTQAEFDAKKAQLLDRM